MEEVIYEDKNVVVRSNQGDFTADKVGYTYGLGVYDNLSQSEEVFAAVKVSFYDGQAVSMIDLASMFLKNKPSLSHYYNLDYEETKLKKFSCIIYLKKKNCVCDPESFQFFTYFYIYIYIYIYI